MRKQIVSSDVPKIKSLISGVIKYNGDIKIERMGGLTNHTYKVTLDNGDIFVVRIPGEGTESVINRNDEKVSTQLACDLGIDSNLLYFGQDGSKISEYILDAVTMNPDSMHQSENIKAIAKILHTLHNSGFDTKVSFEVFDMAKTYENAILENNVALFQDYETVKNQITEIKKEVESLCCIVKVPCHNDPLCENWVRGREKMYLIDWEYAGMNDPMWDLADISIEADFSDDEEKILFHHYLRGLEPKKEDWKRFIANKIYVDYLWTLWAQMRVPYDGQPMEDWAAERYTRLKRNISAYKNL